MLCIVEADASLKSVTVPSNAVFESMLGTNEHLGIYEFMRFMRFMREKVTNHLDGLFLWEAGNSSRPGRDKNITM